MAFVLKMSLFQFRFSRKTRKENDKEDAEAGPLAKVKRLEVSIEKPGKSKSQRRKYQTSWKRDYPNLRRRKTRCDVKSAVVFAL